MVREVNQFCCLEHFMHNKIYSCFYILTFFSLFFYFFLLFLFSTHLSLSFFYSSYSQDNTNMMNFFKFFNFVFLVAIFMRWVFGLKKIYFVFSFVVNFIYILKQTLLSWLYKKKTSLKSGFMFKTFKVIKKNCPQTSSFF